MPRLSVLGLILLTFAVALLPARPLLAQNSREPVITPLDFDPAKPEPLEGWWSNGQELLRLEPNGAYRFWLTQDRFAPPADRGAWRRSNYVLFDLESYRAKPGTRVRMQLIKQDGVICIEREGMKPFRRSLAPPHVFGDDMLGAWTADKEQLVVLEDGRYEYRRLGNATGITQHSGYWRTEKESLFLAPDTPAVAPIQLDAQRLPDGTIELRGAGGVLHRLIPEERSIPAPSGAPAATPSAPASTPATPPAGQPGASPTTPAASPASGSTPPATTPPASGSTPPAPAGTPANG